MPEVLELAQLAQHDRVAERQVAAGRIDAQLHPQRAVLPARREQAFGEPVGGQDLGRAGCEDLVRLAQVGRQLAGVWSSLTGHQSAGTRRSVCARPL